MKNEQKIYVIKNISVVLGIANLNVVFHSDLSHESMINCVEPMFVFWLVYVSNPWLSLTFIHQLIDS